MDTVGLKRGNPVEWLANCAGRAGGARWPSSPRPGPRSPQRRKPAGEPGAGSRGISARLFGTLEWRVRGLPARLTSRVSRTWSAWPRRAGLSAKRRCSEDKRRKGKEKTTAPRGAKASRRVFALLAVHTIKALAAGQARSRLSGLKARHHNPLCPAERQSWRSSFPRGVASQSLIEPSSLQDARRRTLRRTPRGRPRSVDRGGSALPVLSGCPRILMVRSINGGREAPAVRLHATLVGRRSVAFQGRRA